MSKLSALRSSFRKALKSVFGRDKNAVDLADNYSGDANRENIQRVIGAMNVRKLFYSGPLFLMRSFSAVARSFRPNASNAPKPFID